MSNGGGSGSQSYGIAAVLGIFGIGLMVALPVLALVGLLLIIVFGGFGVLLAPLIALLGGGGSSGASSEEIAAVVQGDGKGQFDTTTVAAEFVEPIQQAGQLCPEIGPVVIAAQLEQASNFNKNLVSPDGAQGIAQLPPAEFTRFGKDDDDNGETSPLDTEDAIMALGRFDCSLVGELRSIVVDPVGLDGPGSPELLSLTLAAVKAGAGPVREARAVPTSEEVQTYVAQVRSRFPKFQGLVKAK